MNAKLNNPSKMFGVFNYTPDSSRYAYKSFLNPITFLSSKSFCDKEFHSFYISCVKDFFLVYHSLIFNLLVLLHAPSHSPDELERVEMHGPVCSGAFIALCPHTVSLLMPLPSKVNSPKHFHTSKQDFFPSCCVTEHPF